jgi:hypothetical protein
MAVFETRQLAGSDSGVVFLHKGEFDEAFKGGMGRSGEWQELGHFLADIRQSAGLTPDKLPESIQGRDV